MSNAYNPDFSRQNPSEQPVKKKKKKSHTGFLYFVLSFSTTCFVSVMAVIVVLYGPFTRSLRDDLITEAMNTMTHQWIASFFFTASDIQAAMGRNMTVEPTAATDVNQIGFGENVKDNATTLPNSPSDGEHIINGIGFIRLSGQSEGSPYNGWAVKIYNPMRLYMALAQGIGTQGEQTSHMCKRLGAFIGINAGGFADAGGQGSGGLPIGVCIIEGHQITGANITGEHRITAFDSHNRLVLGYYTNAQIAAMHFRYAVEFKPFLIINGVPSTIVGNGGYGLDPRTAVGQTKDGVIIFIVINGRRAASRGISIKDLQSLMIQYNCYNASNLDGGSSSTLVFKNQIINHPSSYDGERYIPSAFLVNYQ